MSYTKETIVKCTNLDELFELWKSKPVIETSYIEDGKEVKVTINHKDVFISDGAICPEVWNDRSKGKHILFVLKEAYGEDNDWSLNDWLRKTGPSSNIWYRVTEWVYGITNTTIDEVARYSPDRISFEHSEDKPNEWLSQIAVLNIKKSSGESNSQYGEISAYADYDKEEILREIELLDPDIIVCGATASDINRIAGGKIKSTPCDNWYYWSDAIDGKERLYIDYYHPANRYPTLLNYYGVVNIYQQALKEKNK